MTEHEEEDDDTTLGAGKTAFIVSPIGSRLEPLGSPGRSRYEENLAMWSEVIEPACKQFGLEPVRSDKISEPGEIPDQIFTYLRDAEVVIADVSDGNPNVMYELGLRHSRPGITIQIGEYARLPFDVQTIRTQQFIRTEAGLISARKDLTEALRSGLRAGDTRLRATSVFTEGQSFAPETVSADVQKSASVDDDVVTDEPGVLEIAAEGEVALTHVGEVMVEMTGLLQQFNEISQALVVEINESDAAGKGFAGRLNVARKYEVVFKEPADLFEERANDFFTDVKRVDGLIQWSLSRLEEEPNERHQAPDYASKIVELIDAAESAAVGITQFRDGARQLRKLSTALAGTSKSFERSANRFLEGIQLMSAWRAQAERVRDIDGAA